MRQPEQRIGQLLGGRYRLQELLAVGGMGLVYAAAHEATGRSVAIKLLRSELLTQPDLVRRVSAEARLAVEASHPNVVEVLDAGADENGVPYLVLERLYGRPLEAALERPLSLLATAQALVPVINALVTLHRAGIVHRDIKPANIFLNSDPGGRITPKLLDFGIAKALDHGGSTLSGVAMGTPQYMAPEQALGHHAVGPAADVWSMGVVFVRCLTGQLPFAQATHVRRTLRTVLRREELPGVPDGVAELLMKALEFEPGERPASMHEFRRALLEALSQADPTLDWPGTLVSESPAESELASALANLQGSAGLPLPALARPEHVATRTLARARRVPFRRVALTALLAVLGGAAVMHWRPNGRLGRAGPDLDPALNDPPERVLIQTSRALQPRQAEQTSAAARGADPIAPSALTDDPPLARASKASEPIPAGGGQHPSALAGQATSPDAPTATGSELQKGSPLRIGANRSPIIE